MSNPRTCSECGTSVWQLSAPSSAGWETRTCLATWKILSRLSLLQQASVEGWLWARLDAGRGVTVLALRSALLRVEHAVDYLTSWWVRGQWMQRGTCDARGTSLLSGALGRLPGSRDIGTGTRGARGRPLSAGGGEEQLAHRGSRMQTRFGKGASSSTNVQEWEALEGSVGAGRCLGAAGSRSPGQREPVRFLGYTGDDPGGSQRGIREAKDFRSTNQNYATETTLGGFRVTVNQLYGVTSVLEGGGLYSA